jgi:hypothetical protein
MYSGRRMHGYDRHRFLTVPGSTRFCWVDPTPHLALNYQPTGLFTLKIFNVISNLLGGLDRSGNAVGQMGAGYVVSTSSDSVLFFVSCSRFMLRAFSVRDRAFP